MSRFVFVYSGCESIKDLPSEPTEAQLVNAVKLLETKSILKLFSRSRIFFLNEKTKNRNEKIEPKVKNKFWSTLIDLENKSMKKIIKEIF